MTNLSDHQITRRQNWALIGVALILAFLVVRGCQNSRTRLAETQRMQHVADSLRARLRASEIAISNTRQTYEARMAATRQEKTLATHRADSAGKLLTATQARVKRLLNERIGIMEGPMVGVPADCDTCFELLKSLDMQVTGATENYTALNSLMGYELNLRDSLIEAERRHSDTLQRRADLLASFKAPKIRNKIFVTGTVWSDRSRFGIGGGLTLVTKRDKLWGVKVGVFGGQLFYQGEAGFKLSARKK